MKTLITLDIDFNVPHVIATIHEKTTWKLTLRNPMIMIQIQIAATEIKGTVNISSLLSVYSYSGGFAFL